MVKQITEVRIRPGAWVFYNKLYPIKVDSIKQIAVLNKNDKIRAKVVEAFSKENKTTITKIIWLSNRESYKAYKLMVVYLTKGNNIIRLLADGFFYTRGESNITNTFKYQP